jgi:2-C-methyl-D-erythritol 2,4-cyclodiphosphate synthase
LLKKVLAHNAFCSWKVNNVDLTVITQKPKLAPHISAMRSNLASALQIDLSRVSIKAKTNEKMGFTGRGEGLEAQAVILLIRE